MQSEESSRAKIYCVAGMLLGDEGKGTTTEHIVRTTGSKLVVRWNGGPQPMHHIQLPDGRWHCFSQFGAGTLACLVPEVNPAPPPVRTLMGKYMLLNPRTLLVEASFLVKNFEAETNIETCMQKYMRIDRECFVVTPLHRLVNRILEALRSEKDRYGSTGMGLGNTVTDVFHSHPELLPRGTEISKVDDPDGKKIGKLSCIQIRDFEDPKELHKKLRALCDDKTSQVTQILNTYRSLRGGKRAKTNDMSGKLFNEKYRKVVGVGEIQFHEDSLKRAEKLYFDFINQYTIDSLMQFYTDFARRYASICFVNGIELLKDEILAGNRLVFEGAQGSMLDRVYGIFPHVTKTLCSNDNIWSLLNETGMKEGEDYDIQFYGVFRGYSIRHGHGPLVTTAPTWNAKGCAFEEPHNQTTMWQGAFRSGPFDRLAMRYGISIFGKVDYIAVTCLDRMIRYYRHKEVGEMEKVDGFPEFPICNGYIVPPEIEDVQKILEENTDRFSYEKSEDGKRFIVTELKKGPLEKSYKSMDLLKLMKWSQARYIGMDDCRESLKNRPEMTEEETKLRNITMKEIFERKLCEKGERVAERMGDYVVLVQRILGVKIGSLSFGPCYTDKVWVHNIL